MNDIVIISHLPFFSLFPLQFYASVWPVLIKSLKSLTGFEDGARGQALSQLLPAIEGYTWQTRDEQGYSVVTDALQVRNRGGSFSTSLLFLCSVPEGRASSPSNFIHTW